MPITQLPITQSLKCYIPKKTTVRKKLYAKHRESLLILKFLCGILILIFKLCMRKIKLTM